MKILFSLLLITLSLNSYAATYDITKYGADPSGKSDSYLAFFKIYQKILKHKDERVSIKIPAGKYLISKAINFNILDIHKGKSSSISILGKGPKMSQLFFTGKQAGIVFDYRETEDEIESISITIKDLGLVATLPKQGTALKVLKHKLGAESSIELKVEDVDIMGEKNSNFFMKGIHVNNLWGPYFKNISIRGKFFKDMSDGHRFAMKSGITLNGCFRPHIEMSKIRNMEVGITYSDNPFFNEQAFSFGSVKDSFIEGVIYGVAVSLLGKGAKGQKTGVRITNNQISYRNRGIYLEGTNEVRIRGNTFNNVINSDGRKKDFVSNFNKSIDIELIETKQVFIDANIFSSNDAKKRIGVDIGEESGLVDITNNQFNNNGVAIKNSSKLRSSSTSNSFPGIVNDVTSKLQYIDWYKTVIKNDFKTLRRKDY